MVRPEQSHDTGLRILEVLKVLMEENLTTNELIERLRVNYNFEGVYSQEVFHKYFNTFDMLGLKIKRQGNKYSLSNSIFKVDLSKKEEKALINLVKSIKKLNDKSLEEIICKLIYKIDKCVDVDLNAVLNKTLEDEKLLYNNNIKQNDILTLKNMLYEEQSVCIEYRRKSNVIEKIVVELKEIIEKDNKKYVLCYNPSIGRNKRICIDSIISVKQLPKKVSGVCFLNSVVFEVYGRLASLYKLKPSEKVIDFSNNHLTISNTEEDKDTLLLRLLKYGENCKIVRPKSMQEDFINLTNEILKNLEAV